MTTTSTPEYTYEEFYFGNANWPSGYIWRINKETKKKELLIEYGVGRDTLEEIQAIYENAKDEGSVEPQYVTWTTGGKTMYGLKWWQTLTPESEEKQWAFSKKAGMGDGQTITYENKTPLYPDNKNKNKVECQLEKHLIDTPLYFTTSYSSTPSTITVTFSATVPFNKAM